MKRKRCDSGLRLLIGVSLIVIFGCADLKAQEGRPVRTEAGGKPPYNVVFLIVDQRTYRTRGLTMLCRVAMRLPATASLSRTTTSPLRCARRRARHS